MNDKNMISPGEFKSRLRQSLAGFRDEALRMGEQFFSIPEMGFREEGTENLICRCLDSWQVPYKNHLALHGVMCCFTGNKPGYHIAVLADIDAILVQMEDKKIPFHSCGHSIQTVILLSLIRGFSETNLMEQMPGKVSFFFTPAEEFTELDYRKSLKAQGLVSGLSGKQHMITQGLFDDVDAVLSCHVMGPDPAHPEIVFDAGTSLAGFIHKRAEFSGRDAHSGAVPHLGRNALHAATLSLTAVQMLKDTFPPEAHIRLYPILTEGGTSVNTICSRAVVETYLRSQDEASLKEISSKLDNLFKSCAQALEIGCTIKNSPGYLPLSQDPSLTKTVTANMLELWDEDQILKNSISGASGDIGDISAILPTIHFGFSGIEGRIHSGDFIIRDTRRVYEDTASLFAGIIGDLLLQEDLQVRYPDKKERKEHYLKTWLAEQ
jgi:amidohydrolase